MKTPISKTRFYPRTFRVIGNHVSLVPSFYRGEAQVPTILITYSSISSLSVKLQVWAELTHKGKDDPIGHDHLFVHLGYTMRTLWIRRPARKLLATDCDSADALKKWLASMKEALLGGNDSAVIPGSFGSYVEIVFPPLFDAVRVLAGYLKEALMLRVALLAVHGSDTSEVPTHPRFKLRFN